MKRVSKENFIKLIKAAEPQKPAADFTQSVMDEISADRQNETAINPGLKTLLQQQSVEKAPGNITDSVMSQVVGIEQKKGYVPLISKKAWYLIAAGIITMLALLICSSGNAPASTQYKPDYAGFTDSIIHSIPSVYLVVIMMVSVLLYLDYIINSRISISKLRTNQSN